MNQQDTAATKPATAQRRYLVRSEPDEIIVALEHEPKVRSLLRAFQIEAASERSDNLGLSKLTISDVDGAAKALVDHVNASEAASTWRTQHPLAENAPALDQLLWGLRGFFASCYDGWSPTIGKNRLVGKVHGVGHVIHGGGGDPQAAEGSKFAPRAALPGQGVRVGVLDTKIYAQPWLAGGWVAPFDNTYTTSPATSYAQGHATFLAGLVLSQAPGATVVARSVLDDEGKATSWDVAKAMVELGNTGLDVLNLSFACYTEDGEPPMVLSAAIDRLDPELVVIAAAGNHGQADLDGDGFTEDDNRKPAWPAALDDVFAVGAAKNDEGERAEFSPDAPWLDASAPGVDLVSTYLPGVKQPEGEPPIKDYAQWSGTSFAAALVSGAVAAEKQLKGISGRQALRNIVGGHSDDDPPAVDLQGGQPPRFPSAPFLRIHPSTPWPGTP
jgi:hypothetical protein